MKFTYLFPSFLILLIFYDLSLITIGNWNPELPVDYLYMEFIQDTLYKTKDFTTEHLFTSGIEGPAVNQNGDLFLVNYQKEGTIGKVTSDGYCSLYIKLPEGSTGNGIRISAEGDLFIADYTGHKIWKYQRSDSSLKVFTYEPEMNQPNDLAISRSGILYASDPNWQEGTGNLWKVNKNGKAILIESNMGTTNGIDLSPDDSKLYVNESVQKRIWVFNLDSLGQPSEKKIFFQFPDYSLDGMRTDIRGNLYITRHGKGTIVVLNKEGKKIREIPLTGQKPSNIAFGGPEGRTCYVTLQDRGCIETFRAEFPGRAWKLFHE